MQDDVRPFNASPGENSFLSDQLGGLTVFFSPYVESWAHSGPTMQASLATALESKKHVCKQTQTDPMMFVLEQLPGHPWVIVFEQTKTAYLASTGLQFELLALRLNGDHQDLKALIDLFLTAHRHDSANLADEVLAEQNLSHPRDLGDNSRHQLQELIRNSKKSFSQVFQGKMFALLVEHPRFRTILLKLVAALATLQHDRKGKTSKNLILERLDEMKPYAPKGLAILGQLARTLVQVTPAFFVVYFVRVISHLAAKQFLCSPKPKDLSKTLQNLSHSKRCFSLDRLGELVLSQQEAKVYLEDCLRLIREARTWGGEKNVADRRWAELSIKVSGLHDHFDPLNREEVFSQVGISLRSLFTEALESGVALNIDAEHIALRDDVMLCVLRELENPKWDELELGMVIQGYLSDAMAPLKMLLDHSRKYGRRFPIRLVKGAYWDQETIEAKAHGHPSVQFEQKGETDLHYRALMGFILEHHEAFQLLVGSHNVDDHAYAIELKKLYPKALPLEHQCLYKTFDALSISLASQGHAVRDYIPVGDLVMGMGYLVRRILENSSQLGFLAQAHEQQVAPKSIPLSSRARTRHEFQIREEFINVSPARLYRPEQKRQWESCQEKLKGPFASVFSELKSMLQGHSPLEESTEHQLDQWGATPRPEGSFDDCVSLPLLRLASTFFGYRAPLAHFIAVEAKKTPLEAFADVDEAVDFILFYLHETMKKGSPKKAWHKKCAVIGPWNFALAIPCGMAVSSLLSGHRVVLKSSEYTPLIIELFTRLAHACGIPQSLLLHAHGLGKTVGQRVMKMGVDGLIFTGSKKTGEKLYAQMGERAKVSGSVRIITEMGGKNAAIILPDAELDETISSLLKACFSHASQKCSACSRLFVHQDILSRFTERFVAACSNLRVGASLRPGVQINPLIHEQELALRRQLIPGLVQEARQAGGKVLLDRSAEGAHEGAMGPLLVLIPLQRSLSKESFTHQELFCPIVHVIPYTNQQDATQAINSVEYALTAGIYTQSDRNAAFVADKIQAGNIYINRPQTAARVSVEPFGGFKASGTGPKAGGDSMLPFLREDGDSLTQLFGPLPQQQLERQEKVREIFEALKETTRTREIPGQKQVLDLGLIKSAIVWSRPLESCHEDFGYLKVLADYLQIPSLTSAERSVFAGELWNACVVGAPDGVGKHDFVIPGDSPLALELLRDCLFYPRLIGESTLRYGSPLQAD